MGSTTYTGDEPMPAYRESGSTITSEGLTQWQGMVKGPLSLPLRNCTGGAGLGA